MSSNNKTSYLISSQVPDFVRDDHPQFVEFLKAYHRFMEQEGETQYVLKNFAEYLDIDGISKDVLEDTEVVNPSYYIMQQRFYDNFISLFPKDMIADKDLVLKHVQNFYRARGTEKSTKFLSRAVYNKEAEFYYPKDNILKVSDGKWYVEKTLNIKDVAVSNVANTIAAPRFVNTTIRGAQSNSTAIVERINPYYENGVLITELTLSSVEQDFINGEKLITFIEEEGQVKELSANLFSGIITTAYVQNPGSGYVQGASVPISSNSGSGGQIIISKVTKSRLEGKIKGVEVVLPGAGFQAGDPLLFAGGGGRFAAANVFSVNPDETYHRSDYNIVSETINLEANTTIGNSVYSNISGSNANTVMENAFTYWTYANCGPIVACAIINPGQNYIEIPTVDVVSNTIIRSLGILGRMEIANGGFGYVVGDVINIENPPGSLGDGAKGQVSVVDANGTITQIDWDDTVTGFPPGGLGYNQSVLPIANVVSANASAYGANVEIKAILADGEALKATANVIGAIEKLTVVSGGVGYLTPPTLDLSTQGDGTAQASANIVTGIYTYPGRYLNDDGQLSAYNFLQDRDYYQEYSYVIKIAESINKYRRSFKDLIHPAGAKMFGEYQYRNSDIAYEEGIDIANTYVLPTYANANVNLLLHIDAANSKSYSNTSYTYNVTHMKANVAANGRPERGENVYRRPNGAWFKVNTVSYFTVNNTVINLANTNIVGNLTNGTYYSGGGFTFDGVNDYIVFPHKPTLNVANGLDIYMTAISYFDSGDANNTYKTLISKNDPFFTRGFEMYQYGNNLGVIISTYSSNNIVLSTSANLKPNTWYQGAFTYDGGNIRLYLNGQMISMSPGGADGFPDSREPLYIGIRGGITPNTYYGRIAISQLYDRLFSNSDIQQNYTKYRGRFGI